MKYFLSMSLFVVIGFTGTAFAEYPVDEDLTNLAKIWCTGNHSEDMLIDFLGIIDYIDPEDHNTFFQEKFAEELLMRTPELTVHGSDVGAFFITQKDEAILSCPPVISFEGSFQARDGNRYDFTIWHDSAKTYDYEIKDMVLPTPLKQFNSGIAFVEIQCKDNLTLIQKYDGSSACVKYSSKQKLLERHWTESPSYKVVGLGKSYVGEPITIAVEKIGWNQCNNYDAKIYTSSYGNVWSYSSSDSCVTLDPPKLSKSIIDVPRNKKYPIIETTGNYIFEIKFGHTVITEEFFVKNLISKPTQSTISVFCGPTMEQIQKESSIDVLTPKNLPVGYSLKSTDNNHSGIILLNYARGNTCGPDAQTLKDGKIEMVIAFSPEAPLESDGEMFLEQYKARYREHSIGFQTSVVDSRLYLIGVDGTIQQLVDDDGVYDEKWIESTRVHVFDEKNAAGYKITAHLPLYEVMSIAKSLSETG